MDAILTSLGYLFVLALTARFIYAAVIGYRDGIVRQRIRNPFAKQEEYYEGARARRYGWYCVIVGGLFTALFLGALIPWHRFDLL